MERTPTYPPGTSNGTRSDDNVGDDAHIVPNPHATSLSVEWNRKWITTNLP